MRNQRITSILLFCFAIIVGFYNTIAGAAWVALFAIPFLLAIILNGRMAKISEAAGMFVVSVCALIFMDFKIGMIFLLVTFILLKTFTKNKIVSYSFIGTSILMMFIIDFLRTENSLSSVVHALIDTLLFTVMIECVDLYINESIEKADKTNLEKECMAILEKSLELNTESLKIINELQEDKDGRNS